MGLGSTLDFRVSREGLSEEMTLILSPKAWEEPVICVSAGGD